MVDVETKTKIEKRSKRLYGKNNHECAGAVGTDGH